MNNEHPGSVRFAEAIAAGQPIAGSPAQAAELVAHEMRLAARIAPDIVRCSRCNKIGPRDTDSLIADTGACVRCGREYDERERKREYMTDALIDYRKSPERDFDRQEDDE